MPKAAANTETNASAEQPAALTNFVDQIGTLTYPRAVAAFGKDRALGAMRKVAEIGGHGHFEDAEFMSPMFGGLAMPSPEKLQKPTFEEFEKFPEGEFYFQEALGQYEENKKRASSDLARINEYYNSLK